MHVPCYATCIHDHVKAMPSPTGPSLRRRKPAPEPWVAGAEPAISADSSPPKVRGRRSSPSPSPPPFRRRSSRSRSRSLGVRVEEQEQPEGGSPTGRSSPVGSEEWCKDRKKERKQRRERKEARRSPVLSPEMAALAEGRSSPRGGDKRLRSPVLSVEEAVGESRSSPRWRFAPPPALPRPSPKRLRSPVPSSEAVGGVSLGFRQSPREGGGAAKRQRPDSGEVPEDAPRRGGAAAKRGKGSIDRSHPYVKYERRDKIAGHEAFPSVAEVERTLEERDGLRRRRDWAGGDALQEQLRRELNVHILDKQRLWGLGGVKWREAATAAATDPGRRSPTAADSGRRSPVAAEARDGPGAPRRTGAGLARSASLPNNGPGRPTAALDDAGSQRRLGGGLARQPSRLPGEPDDKVILDYVQGNHYTWSKWLGVLNTSDSSRAGKSRSEAVRTARDPKRHDRSTRREFWRSQHPEFRAKNLARSALRCASNPSLFPPFPPFCSV